MHLWWMYKWIYAKVWDKNKWLSWELFSNKKCRKKHTNLKDDCYISDSDEDFQYDSSVDNLLTNDESSDEETNIVPSCIEDLSQGNYVLYEWVENEYYVGTIMDITTKK